MQDIASLPPGDFTSYTDFSVKGDREKAGREATARAVQAEKQREREAYVNLVQNLEEDQHAPPPPPDLGLGGRDPGWLWTGYSEDGAPDPGDVGFGGEDSPW